MYNSVQSSIMNVSKHFVDEEIFVKKFSGIRNIFLIQEHFPLIDKQGHTILKTFSEPGHNC